MSVKDKIILITGASDGIGKTVALEFAKKGAKLILLGSNGSKLSACLLYTSPSPRDRG